MSKRMPRQLPRRIKLGAEWCRVKRCDPGDGALGHIDMKDAPWQIVVRPQHRVGEHLILLHEVLHGIDEMLVNEKIAPDCKSEDWITNAAPLLLYALASAGLYADMTAGAVEDFMDAESKAAALEAATP